MLLVAIAVSSMCQSAQARPLSEYEKALEALDESRYDSAIAHLRNVLAACPGDADAHAELGRAYMNMDRCAESIRESSQALKLNPGLARAYANRAYCQFKLGKFQLGFADSQKAIDCYSVNPLDYLIWPCLNNRAQAYKLTGRADLAAEDRKRAAVYDRLDEAAKMREQGELELAIERIDKTLAEDSMNADLWFMRGIVSSAQRRHWQAIADFTRAIRFSPTSTVIYYFRGDCFEQLGMHQRAIEDFTHVINANPKLVAYNFVCETGRLRDQFLRDDTYPVVVADVRYLRAQSLSALGKNQQALADLDSVLAFDKTDEKALSRRAELVLRMGKVSDAINDYTRAIESNSTDWKKLKERADAYLHLGRNQEALADLTKIISLNNKDPGAYLLRAVAFQSIGDFQRAADDFSTVTKLNPRDDDAFVSRAECYRRLRRFDEALRDLEQAVALDPANESLASEQRAAIFADRGQEDRARAEMLGLEKRTPKSARVNFSKLLPGLSISLILIGAGSFLLFRRRRR